MSEKRAAGAADEVLVEMKNAHQLILVAVTTVIGLVLGFFAPRVIGWALGIGGLPFEKPMQLLQRISESWGSWVLIIVGGVIGVIGGLILLSGLISAKITARDITIIKGSTKKRFARSQVALVLIDEGHLVLRDSADADLVREKIEGSNEDLVTALRRYDWPIESDQLEG
ncbi:YqeB family protein [Microlunatus speluncae]|uniref:YqeB family protein n=1 Tax=Microlunatus speluncae TaxID=2594267 RepID=UPI0012662EE2|nr:hypothetical protein [Microlunatus speluncae]